MAKIQLPHLSTELAGFPVVEGAFRNITNNLRSGVWNPPEVANWGTVTDVQGRYQLVGNLCMIYIAVAGVFPVLQSSQTNKYLTLPVAAIESRVLPPGHDEPLPLSMMSLLADKDYRCALYLDGDQVGKIGVHNSTDIPISGIIRIAGWYWVKG